MLITALLRYLSDGMEYTENEPLLFLQTFLKEKPSKRKEGNMPS